MTTDLFDAMFKQTLGLHRYANQLYGSAASTFPPYNIILDDLLRGVS